MGRKTSQPEDRTTASRGHAASASLVRDGAGNVETLAAEIGRCESASFKTRGGEAREIRGKGLGRRCDAHRDQVRRIEGWRNKNQSIEVGCVKNPLSWIGNTRFGYIKSGGTQGRRLPSWRSRCIEASRPRREPHHPTRFGTASHQDPHRRLIGCGYA